MRTFPFHCLLSCYCTQRWPFPHSCVVSPLRHVFVLFLVGGRTMSLFGRRRGSILSGSRVVSDWRYVVDGCELGRTNGEGVGTNKNFEITK